MMGHDIFISCAGPDIPFAEALVQGLESGGCRCWHAPRDLASGASRPVAVTRAIKQAPLMLMVFSASSNMSEELPVELALASSGKCIIIPLRVDGAVPGAELEHYLSDRQWLDARGLEGASATGLVLEALKPYAGLLESHRNGDNQPIAGGLPSAAAVRSAPEASAPSARVLGKPLALLAALLLLAGGGAYYLSGQPEKPAVDPEAELLAPHRDARVVKYVSANGPPVSVHTFVLAPLKGGSTPYECLLVFNGVGGSREGMVFRCNRAIGASVRYTADINGITRTLLQVSNQGDGLAFQPDNGGEIPVIYGGVHGQADTAETMLKAYREGLPWKPGLR